MVCWKLDRCFRSIQDCVNTLHELGSLGVEFVSLRDSGIDMTTPSGKLMMTMIAAFAAFESEVNDNEAFITFDGFKYYSRQDVENLLI